MTKNKIKQFKLFNTLNREVEVFKPIEEGKIRFYTCGSTVYGTAHLGKLRTYISEDFIRRAMEAAVARDWRHARLPPSSEAT